jgi:pilus assembly protein Flp/PilA
VLGLFKKLLFDENGASAVEYGLIVGLIAVVIIVAVSGLGQELKAVFEGIVAKLQNNPEL